MTKISTYNIDDNVTANDKWIGSDVNNFNKTKNFTPKKLAIYFNGSQVINTGMELLYKYFTITPPETRPVGTISFENEIGPVVSFSSITTFLISKYTQKGNEVNEFLGFLVGTKSLLYKADDVNIFGYYDIVSIDPYIDDNNFYVVTLSFIEGNGSIEEDKDYMISMIDANTAEAQDLQSVTDLGSTTTNTITAEAFIKNDGDGTNLLLDDGTTIPLYDVGNQSLQDVTDVGNTTDNKIIINTSFSEDIALHINGGDTGIDVTGNNYGLKVKTLSGDGIIFTGITSTGTIAEYFIGSTGHGIVIHNEETSTGDIFSLVRGTGTIFNIDSYGAIDSNSHIVSNLISPSEYSSITGINDNLPDINFTLKPSGIYGNGYYGGRFTSIFTGGSAILAEAGDSTGITILVNSSESINAINIIDEELFSVMNVGKDGDITAHSFIKKDGTGTNLLLDDGTTIPLNDVGNQSLQDVTDVGSVTTNTIIIDSANYYSSLGPDAIGTENKDTGTYTYIGADGLLGIKNEIVESQLKNTNVTNNGIILEFPNKTSGSYTLATTSDLGTNLSPSQTSTSFTINSDNGTDATIPLGDGSYAGATLNNYTTAEKNKLAGIATGANVGVVPNSPITGATKTKITYDSKGLVTSGTNATTDDIGEGVTNLYWSNLRTIDSVLNGISISGTSIISTDTILQALGKAQNQINSLTGGVTYQGVWNALTNSPTLTSSVGTKGFYYVVSVAGSTNLNGITDWKLGDWAIYDGTAWQKVDNTDSVISVNGYTGIVSLTTADITDSTNKRYVTDANLVVIGNTSGTNTGDQNLQTVTNGVGNNTTTNTITAASLIKDGGQSSQFLKADGSVDNNTYLTAANLPSTLTLYATNVSAGINGYSKLVTTIDNPDYPNPAVPVSTGAIATTGQFIAGLVSDANLINGNPGIFNVTTIGEISRTNGTGTAEFYFILYKRTSAGVETLIGTSGVTLPVTNSGYSEFQASAIWNDGVFDITDRIVIKYYANRISGGSNPTYSFLFGGSVSPVRTIVPIPTSVIPNIYVAQLADVEDVPALNNEVLFYNTSVSLWEHSLVEDLMPTATSSVTGKLLNTDWTNFNTAYTSRISTFSVTGNSGAATFSGNTLNIPEYTLSGLGGAGLASANDFTNYNTFAYNQDDDVVVSITNVGVGGGLSVSAGGGTSAYIAYGVESTSTGIRLNGSSSGNGNPLLVYDGNNIVSQINSNGTIIGTVLKVYGGLTTGFLKANGDIDSTAYATGGGTATGTNTGDETSSTIKTKLGITTLSGSNTGDVTLATNSGLSFTSGQTSLTLGTPGTITAASTNSVTTSTHTHAITPSLEFIGVGTAQYQVAVTGATTFTPIWTSSTNIYGGSGLNSLSYSVPAIVKMTAANTFILDPITNYATGGGTATGTNTGNETTTTIGTLINASTFAAPNDTDYVATSDATTPLLKKITWTNIKTFLKTYFDTLYSDKVYNITITTTISIDTNATGNYNLVSGYGQNGRNVMIQNTTNPINITCQSSSTTDFIATYTKLSASGVNITFLAGAGATLTTLSGTAIMSGGAGSTALLTRSVNTFYLQINNI